MLATPSAALAAKSGTPGPRYTVERHWSNPRLRQIHIEAGVVRAFLDQTRTIDVQNLEYVPFMRHRLADWLEYLVGDGFGAVLQTLVADRASGGFVLSVEGTTESTDDFIRFGTAVGHMIGPANHDAMSGKYYARFHVRHTDDSDSYLRQAYRLFTLHTDGTFVSEATDWLLMMKFAEKNAVGGESRLLHLDDWAERTQFENHPLGRIPFRYKAPGSKNSAEEIERPVFFETSYGMAMSFIDQFVQPRTRDEAAFLYDLSESMEQSAGTREVALPVGELVVLNNYFWLHGRAPFQSHVALERELMRLRGMIATSYS